jgi:hypothetical protein
VPSRSAQRSDCAALTTISARCGLFFQQVHDLVEVLVQRHGGRVEPGAAGEQVRGESIDDADGTGQAGDDRRLGHRGARGEDFVARTLDRAGAGDVDADGLDPVRWLSVAAPDDDGAVGIGEPLRESAPDARGAAGDENGAVGDLHYDLPGSSW